MNIHVDVQMPDELLLEFLQHLRDFEAPRSTVHMAIGVDVPEMDVKTVQETLAKLKPPYKHRKTFRITGPTEPS